MYTPNLSCGVTYTTWNALMSGTIGQDGQGFFRAVVAVLHGTIGQDGQGFFRAVSARGCSNNSFFAV